MESRVKLANFWKNKRVLLTGHTGFKGSWLALWLHELGADVIGYALKPQYNNSFYAVCGLQQKITSYYADITDQEQLMAVAKQHSPEIVIHMAAQSLVLPSYKRPIETYNTNVMGTLHVFEMARRVPDCRVILNITSDKCYENKNWLWPYRESDEMGGYDPYSSSKGCAELLTSSYRRSYFSDQSKILISARAGNCVGGGDRAKYRIIPDIISSVEQQKTLNIRSPHAIRPWQHVLDPLQGYLQLVEYGWQHMKLPHANAASGWNFGPAGSLMRPVSWIVEQAAQIFGNRFHYVFQNDSTSQHEASILKLDSTKAAQLLGWQPRLKDQQIIEWTLKWYQNYFDHKDMYAYSLQQIQQFYSLFDNYTLPQPKIGASI